MDFKKTKFYPIKRIVFISLASFLMALNINSFIYAGDLIPGGFMGVALLLRQIGGLFFNTDIPFSPMFYGFCLIPAIISYFHIGKKFTIYSCISIFLVGIFTDSIPPIFANYLRVQNPLLSVVFGGLLNAFAISLCLHAGATSGGTDFIAILISEKCKQDGWRYIFFFNCIVLFAAACIFDIDKVLYSVIFQYITTIGIKYFYLGYQQKTLLIITDSPVAVYEAIKNSCDRAATSFDGIGQFQKKERTLIYSVVSADEVNSVILEIKKCDADAFVNVIRSEYIKGNFRYRERD
ncbi:MAG: YitT family protein [Chitinispirillales bacterium]|jgi:uncharacterized membrane-anchored protein YitT (DUF2179 family)|nr:YitT family protein [Chitinispirillales bacterium]